MSTYFGMLVIVIRQALTTHRNVKKIPFRNEKESFFIFK